MKAFVTIAAWPVSSHAGPLDNRPLPIPDHGLSDAMILSVSSHARGKFITIEGLDGCGKSTQLEKLSAVLRARGSAVDGDSRTRRHSDGR